MPVVAAVTHSINFCLPFLAHPLARQSKRVPAINRGEKYNIYHQNQGLYRGNTQEYYLVVIFVM